MENFTPRINEALLTVDNGAKRPLRRNPQRPTHLSLPKLIIKPHGGPAPTQIPTAQIDYFINIIAAQPRKPITLLPLPVFPGSPNHNFRLQSNGEHPDPYLTDLLTPVTIQFTNNEALELEQWQQIVGGMRNAHAETLEQLMHNPKDTLLRKEVRRLRSEREKHATAIAQIHERRRIRKAFRRDFNHALVGW
ncbi:hypothetical protein F5Y12DRAFT_718691 [Xylaria sp. FL1777]|nr:hypothetical protein F5Y12DRAFT_718691 [Xylaria sp. FL1777]